ncbi:hypothetical protein RPD_4091 [Rhodopseudomonas palustris BisB5]|uniref:Uncharacterized protein n=1 Tax=Rhodopseudomonas palustris (strain BisB5) TaxID=316057 RepID=Q131C9_RHOPS|nr:hypothetical protein RPD_4091 [Rhodopseudomonas palustris BisB5]
MPVGLSGAALDGRFIGQPRRTCQRPSSEKCRVRWNIRFLSIAQGFLAPRAVLKPHSSDVLAKIDGPSFSGWGSPQPDFARQGRDRDAIIANSSVGFGFEHCPPLTFAPAASNLAPLVERPRRSPGSLLRPRGETAGPGAAGGSRDPADREKAPTGQGHLRPAKADRLGNLGDGD